MARRKTKQTLPEGKARLNLVLDADLKEFARDYARRHHTQITQVIVDHLLELRERERGLDVDQI